MAQMNIESDNDASFELNLAPMLDIIVSIIPMLLLSVAFIEISTIDTPLPQVVQNAIAASDVKGENTVKISLAVSSSSGFRFMVSSSGRMIEVPVALKDGRLDFENLNHQAIVLKQKFPEVFRVDLQPERNIPLESLVATMDTLRKKANSSEKIFIVDPQTGQSVETDLIFPEIIFGNVMGG
jgi:biopolymer transport protein ExbD